MPTQPGLATLADVAEAADATPADASAVVGGDARVPAAVRERISAAIEAVGYRPWAAVQAELGRPVRLAVVFKRHRGDDPDVNAFYLPIASGLARACERYGAEPIGATVATDDQYRLLDVPAALTDGSCDGAFLLGTQLDAAAVSQLKRALPPLVLVDGYSEGDAFDSVVTDNARGARLAVEHLAAAGHTRIALVGTEPVCYPSMLERRHGYAAAMTERNLRLRYVDTGYTLAEAVGVLGVDYLNHNPAVTALFCANDFLAVHVLQVARESGYRVPADVSIVGFDDIDLASLVIPALTTIAVDKTAMARAAFALLAHRVEIDPLESLRSVVRPRLVERESTGPARPDAG